MEKAGISLSQLIENRNFSFLLSRPDMSPGASAFISPPISALPTVQGAGNAKCKYCETNLIPFSDTLDRTLSHAVSSRHASVQPTIQAVPGMQSTILRNEPNPIFGHSLPKLHHRHPPRTACSQRWSCKHSIGKARRCWSSRSAAWRMECPHPGDGVFGMRRRRRHRGHKNLRGAVVERSPMPPGRR